MQSSITGRKGMFRRSEGDSPLVTLFQNLDHLRRAIAGIISDAIIQLISPYLYKIRLSLLHAAKSPRRRVLPLHGNDTRIAHIRLKSISHHIAIAAGALIISHRHLARRRICQRLDADRHQAIAGRRLEELAVSELLSVATTL